MDDCKEQQLQELEALKSMYANELNILCEDYPGVSISIEIRPDSTEFENIFGKDLFQFNATLPADYPNIGPEIDLSDLKMSNESGEDNNNGNIKDECKELLIGKVEEELKKAVEESLGMPMLFTLINTLQDSLVQVCTNHVDELAELARKKAEQAEKEEMARFEGTRVTVESFNKWNEAFLKEITLKKARENKEVASSGDRLTGKQLFLADKSLNISDLQFLNSKEDESGQKEEEAEAAVEMIDQSLFEDDLDINDDSDDEDYVPEEED